MADERAHAVLVHAIPSRARLRIHDKGGDEPFFTALASALAQVPAVRQVRADAFTGSVLILHDGELRPILDAAEQQGLLVLTPPQHAPMQSLLGTIERIDAEISAETEQRFSLAKAAFVLLVSAGLWQAKEGQLLPAGMVLFGYAFRTMEWAAARESAALQPRSP